MSEKQTYSVGRSRMAHVDIGGVSVVWRDDRPDETLMLWASDDYDTGASLTAEEARSVAAALMQAAAALTV